MRCRTSSQRYEEWCSVIFQCFLFKRIVDRSHINLDFLLEKVLSSCICFLPLNLSVPFSVIGRILFTSILIIVFPWLVFRYLSSFPFELIFHSSFLHSVTYSFQSVSQDSHRERGDTQVRHSGKTYFCFCVCPDFRRLFSDVMFLEDWNCVSLVFVPTSLPPARLSRYSVRLWNNDVYF